MCHQPEKYCSWPGRGNGRCETLVLNCIIQEVYGDAGDRQEQKRRRDTFHDQARCGRWWWKLSCTLGFGLLLGCGDDLFRKM
ncbi:hypothetical protein BDV40DRAFT_112873 [Aspergillus tamarii]|uniref:Uncharacterized protein n=1 Tax=Aspergillus tamarii TaxID=41984 RepID=A0A5N6UAX1_ASPTM|nr:hypothetical protein BDV40DRAFT_112873 [Aspergillus tamarii]